MELTNTTPASDNPALYSREEFVFCTVGFSILIGVAIAGNTLVLVAVARTKKLQNVTNVFVVNLSVTDCMSSFAFLWSVVGMASTTPGYPWSDVPCVVAAAGVFITVGCSMYTLANIALTRCVIITRPTKTYQWLYTPRKVALMVLGSWLIPLCSIVVPPLCGVGDVGFDPTSRTCSDIDTRTGAAVFDKIQFATLYPLPLIVITVSYVLVWRHIRRHFRKRRLAAADRQSSGVTLSALSSTSKQDDSLSRVTTDRTGSLQHVNRTRHRGRMKDDQLAITKNLFVVVFAFLVCFTPLCIMVVSKRNRYQLYGAMVLFMSGCINPVIYAAKHPHFRPVLRSMLRCRCSENAGLDSP